MTRFSDSEIILKMKETGLVPIFYHEDLNTCRKVIKASYDAGLRVFEFTNRGTNALEVFRELAIYAAQFKDFVLGIGTIFNLKDAKMFYDAGAQFIVSPILIPEILDFYKDKATLCVPGCGTVTEVYMAHSLGAGLIKVFPGNVLGPEFVKAVKAVLPQVNVMPTGGVSPTEENLTSWFTANVSCVGMGSQLISKEIIVSGDYDRLSRDIINTLDIIKGLRK